MSNTTTHAHWFQYRNSDFRLTSVNKNRLCVKLCNVSPDVPAFQRRPDAVVPATGPAQDRLQPRALRHSQPALPHRPLPQPAVVSDAVVVVVELRVVMRDDHAGEQHGGAVGSLQATAFLGRPAAQRAGTRLGGRVSYDWSVKSHDPNLLLWLVIFNLFGEPAFPLAEG